MRPASDPAAASATPACSIRCTTRWPAPAAARRSRRPASGARSGFGEQLAKHRSVAPRFVFAIAAHADVRLPRQRGQERKQPLRLRLAHLGAVLSRERRPARVGPRVGLRPCNERRGRRQLGQPDVVVVEPRVVLLLHASRRTADRADPQAFITRARRSEANDAYQCFALYSASVTGCNHLVSPPKPTLICTSACEAVAPCQWTTFGAV